MLRGPNSPKGRVNLTPRLLLAVPRAEFQVSIESSCATLGRNVNNDVAVWMTQNSAENRPCTHSSFIRYMGQPGLPQARFGTGLWFRNTWKSKCWPTLYLIFRILPWPLPPHIFACVNSLHCYTGENHCSGLFSYLVLTKLLHFKKILLI